MSQCATSIRPAIALVLVALSTLPGLLFDTIFRDGWALVLTPADVVHLPPLHQVRRLP